MSPHRLVAARFENHLYARKDVSTAEGRMRSADGSMVRLCASKKAVIDIAMDEIEQHKNALSAMPESQSKDISRDKMCDLIESLSNL